MELELGLEQRAMLMGPMVPDFDFDFDFDFVIVAVIDLGLQKKRVWKEQEEDEDLERKTIQYVWWLMRRAIHWLEWIRD